MKKGIIVTVAVLSFFIVAINSNAEMKITPGGVTSPDDSATLNLSGSAYGAAGPAGAIISGENSYSGSSVSCGGYFSASSLNAYGVWANATGDNGIGVYSKATGVSGRGVYGSAPTGIFGKGVSGYAGGSKGLGVSGSASGSSGYGVSGVASGNSGRGVYGKASSGGPINYGGYFEASGSMGKGVYGEVSGLNARGVYGYATGGSGYGVHGKATGPNGRGVYGSATGTYGRGVYGYGKQYDFYAGGPGVNYGSFTGAHEVKFSGDMPEEIVPGMIVSVTGRTQTRKDKHGEISLSSTLPTVAISTRARDKAVFGVIVSRCPLPEDHWYEAEKGEHFGVANALGEGRVWVTTRNGEIRAGDYITTSEIPGYGQMQDDDLLHSYTLGKAIETIDWEQVSKTIRHEGEMYKAYLIAVVYTSG